MLKPIPPKQPAAEELEPEATFKSTLDAFVTATSPPSPPPPAPPPAAAAGGLSEEALVDKINAAVGASPYPPLPPRTSPLSFGRCCC